MTVNGSCTLEDGELEKWHLGPGGLERLFKSPVSVLPVFVIVLSVTQTGLLKISTTVVDSPLSFGFSFTYFEALLHVPDELIPFHYEVSLHPW